MKYDKYAIFTSTYTHTHTHTHTHKHIKLIVRHSFSLGSIKCKIPSLEEIHQCSKKTIITSQILIIQ